MFLVQVSSSANEWQQYLASRHEHHPQDNGNGAMTVDYYDKAFGFTGREGLTLMGVHAVGRLNVQFSGNAYSWVRGAKLFNNKYYKLMAGVPDRVFESCTGTMDDKVDMPFTLRSSYLHYIPACSGILCSHCKHPL